jgi:Tol biopolymer transport system component
MKSTLFVIVLAILFAFSFSCSGCGKKGSVDPTPGDLPGEVPETEPPVPIDRDACFSPSGDIIAYTHFDSGYRIWLINIDEEGRGHCARYLFDGRHPDWSPDGRKIAFCKYDQIWVGDTTGENIRQLTFEESNFCPAWHPTENEIIFHTLTRQGFCLRTIKSNGTDLKNLEVRGGSPYWSPDGTKIVYTGWDARGEEAIFIVSRDGTDIVQLTFSPFDGIQYHNQTARYSSWQGTKIIFESYTWPYSQIWILDLKVVDQEGHPIPERLTEKGGERPDWSPDGKWIAYSEYKKGGKIWIMKADGSGKRQLTP